MKRMNLFGQTVVSMAVILAFGGADAAQNGRTSMMSGATSARMPVMPVVSLNTIGNPAVQTVNQPAGVVSTGIPNPGGNVVPVNPNPGPTPVPVPTPDSGCDDGGVKNSKYTVAMCMNDVLQCVNSGGLQGGINDLFNADVRNSVMTGMRLCQTAIDKCVKEVRVNCRNVYNETADVWLDFNSRVIQPEYYNFVLRKTGLTPNQAENTCLLLDRNTYGSSFASVSPDKDRSGGQVNTEYDQDVWAYNDVRKYDNNKNKYTKTKVHQTKDNPLGEDINEKADYDGWRGHYARWDASKAECLIRVAAYNKDKLITNKWLFGAVGDDTPAEVWEKAGSTFTCNKDLFDFNSLLNDTKTVATVAVPGGAVLGASLGMIGAAAEYDNNNKKTEGKGKNKTKTDVAGTCESQEYRNNLSSYFSAHGNDAAELVLYLENNSGNNKSSKTNSKGTGGWSALARNISKTDCETLEDLRNKIARYDYAIQECESLLSDVQNSYLISTYPISNYVPQGIIVDDNTTAETYLDEFGVACKGVINCDAVEDAAKKTTCENFVKTISSSCAFKRLSKYDGSDVLCSGKFGDCVSLSQIKRQLSVLRGLWSGVEPVIDAEKPNKGKEIGKGAAIGAATGAGAGAIATAITALVERSHINCRVGDGLNVVSLGKSHTIDSLKDFYVKWNLNLPDRVSPTGVVTDWQSWDQACGQYNSNLMDCEDITINLKTKNAAGIDIYEEVPKACQRIGNGIGTTCIGNRTIMTSHGFPAQADD